MGAKQHHRTTDGSTEKTPTPSLDHSLQHTPPPRSKGQGGWERWCRSGKVPGAAYHQNEVAFIRDRFWRCAKIVAFSFFPVSKQPLLEEAGPPGHRRTGTACPSLARLPSLSLSLPLWAGPCHLRGWCACVCTDRGRRSVCKGEQLGRPRPFTNRLGPPAAALARPRCLRGGSGAQE